MKDGFGPGAVSSNQSDVRSEQKIGFDAASHNAFSAQLAQEKHGHIVELHLAATAYSGFFQGFLPLLCVSDLILHSEPVCCCYEQRRYKLFECTDDHCLRVFFFLFRQASGR